MKKFYLAIAVILSAAGYAGLSHAQSVQSPSVDAIDIAPDRGAPGMLRWLRELQTRASLLMVTAHPDDEDGIAEFGRRAPNRRPPDSHHTTRELAWSFAAIDADSNPTRCGWTSARDSGALPEKRPPDAATPTHDS